MTPELTAQIAAMVLSFLCLLLLLSIFIQLDLERLRAETLVWSVPAQTQIMRDAAIRADWAADFAAMRADVAFVETPTARFRQTGKDHTDWRFDTDEWHIARESFFAEQPEDMAVMRVSAR